MALLRSSSTPPATAGSGVQPLPTAAPLLPAPLTDAPPPGDPSAFDGGVPPVEVRTSTRRKKTASAYFEGDRYVVVVPARLSAAERQRIVDGLVRRLVRRQGYAVPSDAKLEERAAELADRHLGGVRAASIRWVGNQHQRWASCSTVSGHIRVSDRLKAVPGWVLDTVIVHELAHLLEPSHSPRFHELAGRAARLEEAEAFLKGYALGLRSAGSPGPWPDGGLRPDA